MSVLHKATPDTVVFWCPGCDLAHQVVITGPNAWGFNGDYEKPTFTPSYLTWADPHPNAMDVPVDSPGYNFRNGFRCHSFISDGQIQFLSDCTHKLAGQTVGLPEWK